MNVIFAVTDSAITFTATVDSVVVAARVLALLPPGVPLSDRAIALRDHGDRASA